MILTQPRKWCEAAEVVRAVRVIVNHAHGSQHASAGAGIICDPFKELRMVGKRNAAISPAVLMSAMQVTARVAKQRRAWRHEFTPGRGIVRKVPLTTTAIDVFECCSSNGLSVGPASQTTSDTVHRSPQVSCGD
jgi:hypothetical protein